MQLTVRSRGDTWRRRLLQGMLKRAGRGDMMSCITITPTAYMGSRQGCHDVITITPTAYMGSRQGCHEHAASNSI